MQNIRDERADQRKREDSPQERAEIAIAQGSKDKSLSKKQ